MELGKSDLADSDKRLARHVLEPREVDVLERAHLLLELLLQPRLGVRVRVRVRVRVQCCGQS